MPTAKRDGSVPITNRPSIQHRTESGQTAQWKWLKGSFVNTLLDTFNRRRTT